MRRIASHYIYWQKWYRMHYLELDAEGCLVGVFPLEQEIANPDFYDGTSAFRSFLYGVADCLRLRGCFLSGECLPVSRCFPRDV